MASLILEFNYDISCPFAYIASTRVEALAQRTSATLIWRPVLLGAIYRATSAPQGAAGSASDVFNPTKKAVTARGMRRTLRRYQIEYNPPPQHPRKSVNALRLIYFVPEDQRAKLSKALFRAYWVEGRDVSDNKVLLQIVKECSIFGAGDIEEKAFNFAAPRKELETATAKAIERGAFGVPCFWISQTKWTDVGGDSRVGRFYWGGDRMHFVEASLLAIKNGDDWKDVPAVKSLVPRCIGVNKAAGKTKVEFWYDFSSPWAFLGWTQLKRLQRTFGNDLEIVMKPFLLGILFREIGAPNLPMAAVSAQKAVWSRQDHADWVKFWNVVNEQEGSPDKYIAFLWADIFPIRTPTVLRCALADSSCVEALYRACWEQNANVADDTILADILNNAGFNGAELIKKANTQEIKTKLREATAEAKAIGICGVPSYRVLREDGNDGWKNVGGIVWGQDEINVVEDLVAGWDDETSTELAEARKAQFKTAKVCSKL